MRYTYLLRQTARYTYSAARRYDKKRRLIEEAKTDPGFSDEPVLTALLKSDCVKNYREPFPILLGVRESLYYAWIPVGNGYFLLGPTKFLDPVKLRFEPELPDALIPDDSPLKAVPLYTLQRFSEDILFFYNMERSGEEDEPFLDERELFAWNSPEKEESDDTLATLYNTIFENVENSFAHNPYSHEKRQVTSIRNGDVEGLSRILDERFPGRYGKVASDPLRQEINIGIVETTLASRAAIEGGLHPETAFYLSDITIQKLDVCRDPVAAMRISRESQIYYAKLVRELREKTGEKPPEGENRHISHCKDYVFAHLHGKLTVREIAGAIGLEENYLSALFKKHEGLTLSAYILREKIKLAENLLMYSAYSYIQIATYLGFASQSHFGQAFKRVTGMTPRAYREAYAKEDFINDAMFFPGEM